MSEETHTRRSLPRFAVGTASLTLDSIREITRGSARIARRLGTIGAEAVGQGRDQARAAVRGRVDDALDWVATAVAPKVIDRMVPYLAGSVVPKVVDAAMPYMTSAVVPRVLDSAMPVIRERVVPVIIEDLTRDPDVRELLAEQSRGVVTDAALHLRESAARADDRIESSIRRLPNRSDPQS